MPEVTDPALWERIRSSCDEVGRCLIWRGGVQSGGYPIMSHKGRPEAVRRVVALLLGFSLKPRQPVTCTCGERLCLSPKHIKPTTRAKLLKQAYRNGRRGGVVEIMRREASLRARAKLTIEDVRQLRASDEPAALAAQRLGVGAQAIRAARAGRSWKEHGPWRQLIG